MDHFSQVDHCSQLNHFSLLDYCSQFYHSHLLDPLRQSGHFILFDHFRWLDHLSLLEKTVVVWKCTKQGRLKQGTAFILFSNSKFIIMILNSNLGNTHQSRTKSKMSQYSTSTTKCTSAKSVNSSQCTNNYCLCMTGLCLL